MTLASTIIAKARIINYNSRIVIYSFIVLAIVITIINYNCTVVMIVNYDPKTFIVQTTDWSLSRKNPSRWHHHICWNDNYSTFHDFKILLGICQIRPQNA